MLVYSNDSFRQIYFACAFHDGDRRNAQPVYVMIFILGFVSSLYVGSKINEEGVE